MEYIKYLFTYTLLITVLMSCYSNKYLKKVTRNIDEFSQAIAYLDQNSYLQQQDTIFLKDHSPLSIHHSACWHSDTFDVDFLKRLYSQYNLNRICYSKDKDIFFDSVISFRREYNPFFGKSIIVIYDYGNSNLRKQILNDTSPEGIEYKIINDFFLYRLNRKPAFGE